jgi:hypothetical protein
MNSSVSLNVQIRAIVSSARTPASSSQEKSGEQRLYVDLFRHRPGRHRYLPPGRGKWLHLGLSPMADIDDKEFKHSAFISFNFGHDRCPLFNRFIYPLQGHATHKRDFGDGPSKPTSPSILA